MVTQKGVLFIEMFRSSIRSILNVTIINILCTSSEKPHYTETNYINFIIIIIIIHEFHGDTSLKQNFRVAVNVTY